MSMTATEARKKYDDFWEDTRKRQKEAKDKYYKKYGREGSRDDLKEFGYDQDKEEAERSRLYNQWKKIKEEESKKTSSGNSTFSQQSSTRNSSSTKKESSNLIDNLSATSSTSSSKSSSKSSSTSSSKSSSKSSSTETSNTTEEEKTKEDTSKSEQAAKENAKKTSRQGKIQEIAGKYLEKRLDSMLESGLKGIWDNLEIDDEEVREQAKALIRGYIVAESGLNPDIVAAKAEISKALTNCVNEQIKHYAGLATEEINKELEQFNAYAEVYDNYMEQAKDYMDKFDKEERRISTQIDVALLRTTNWTDDKSMHAIDKFIEGLDKAIDRGGLSIMHKIDGKINNIPLMKQLGISFKSEKLLGKTFQDIEKRISNPLEKKLKPYLQENVKKITSAVKYVNKRLADIKKAENKIRDEIKKQEEVARQFAETKLKAFAADIASRVNISLGGLTSGFGGFHL